MRRIVLVCCVLLLWYWWQCFLLVETGGGLLAQQPALSRFSSVAFPQGDDASYTVTGPPTISAAFIMTWTEGYHDWYNLILYGYVRGQVAIPIAGHVCTTVDEIVPVYAPSSDKNDVAVYIAAIKHAVDIWRRGQLWA